MKQILSMLSSLSTGMINLVKMGKLDDSMNERFSVLTDELF